MQLSSLLLWGAVPVAIFPFAVAVVGEFYAGLRGYGYRGEGQDLYDKSGAGGRLFFPERLFLERAGKFIYFFFLTVPLGIGMAIVGCLLHMFA